MSIVSDALKKAARTHESGPVTDVEVEEARVADSPNLYDVRTQTFHREYSRGRRYLVLGLLLFLLTGLGWWGTGSFDRRPVPSGQAPEAVPSVSSSAASIAEPASGPDMGTLFLQGVQQYQRKNYPGAEQAFRAALDRSPDDPDLHNNLGLVYQAQGRSRDALLHYLVALELRPGFAEAINNLALWYEQQGGPDEALQLYRLALELQPDLAEAHLNYAILRERQGERQEARRHYLRFLELADRDLPDLARAVRSRINTLL